MKIAKTVIAVLALIAGVMMLWQALLGTLFILALQAWEWKDLVIFIGAGVFLTAGGLLLTARQAPNLRREGLSVGLLAGLTVLGLLMRRSYVDLYLQAGVLLVAFGVVLAVELRQQPRRA